MPIWAQIGRIVSIIILLFLYSYAWNKAIPILKYIRKHGLVNGNRRVCYGRASIFWVVINGLVLAIWFIASWCV